MNEVIQNILTRRSWRSYQSRQIDDEQLEAILQCGLYAPSAMNQQSWHFTVLQNRELIDKLTKGCQQMMGIQHDPFYGAPTLVLVTGREGNIAPVADCALAMENMFLAAASLGIGSCWINCLGRYLATEPGKAFAREIGIPEGYQGVGCVILGLPQGEAPQPKERATGTVNILK